MTVSLARGRSTPSTPSTPSAPSAPSTHSTPSTPRVHLADERSGITHGLVRQKYSRGAGAVR
jgi:hypothetical protein